ncbi:hypothetical protein NDU88_001988 [Pleurodeles waltl]|uniref:Uncharacterized protein n=1 Tax=Pleurodeles waltl TaxID=8319 RepID=A0AAV7UUB0_PLEWA|nr:hypothetical protein NDU88_001988 [Pleurodeles waltl]
MQTGSKFGPTSKENRSKQIPKEVGTVLRTSGAGRQQTTFPEEAVPASGTEGRNTDSFKHISNRVMPNKVDNVANRGVRNAKLKYELCRTCRK